MDQIGRYEILEELGRGGEGVVYLGHDPGIGRKVAIKTLLVAGGNDDSDQLAARLQREAKSAGRLAHPNIVTVYEWVNDGNTSYLVMEYVEGETLTRRLIGGGTDYPAIMKLLAQAADALDFAHAEGVVHRDVKPANMIISARGTLKVADFGIAKLRDAGLGPKTETGMIRGTAFYLSPEQIEGEPVTGRSDQFSLAVVAYEWLAGRKPFEADSLASLLNKILRIQPPPLDGKTGPPGERATEVLRKAMSKAPGDRYESCRAFVDALSEALEVTGLVTGTATVPVARPAAKAAVADKPVKRAVGFRGDKLLLAGLVLAAGAFGVASYLKLKNAGANQAEAAAVVPAPKQEPARQPDPPKPVEAARPKEEKKSPPVPEKSRVVAAAKKEDRAGAVRPEEKPEPPAAPPATPVTAAPAAAVPMGRYFGPPNGRVSWSGSLPAGERLTISGNRVSGGGIRGKGLPPGLAVSVSLDSAGVRVVEEPRASNGYTLVLRNSGGTEIQSFTIRWDEKKE